MDTEQRQAGFRLFERAALTESEVLHSEVFAGTDGGEFGFRVELQFVRGADESSVGDESGALGFLFALGVLSFADARPRGASEMHSQGPVVIDTQGRGKSAEHWLARLQGAKHLRPIGE